MPDNESLDHDENAQPSPRRGSRCLTFGMRLAALEAGRDPFKWPADECAAAAADSNTSVADRESDKK